MKNKSIKNKLIKKLVSTVVIACMLFSSFGAAFGATASATSDTKGHWAENQISTWIDKGLIKGYEDGSFKPENKITRAEFIALINRSFAFTESTEIAFSDVASDNWAYAEVAKAVKADYITGYTNGTIGINNPISRQEVAVIVSRLLKLQPADQAAADSFLDASKIASWSKDAIDEVVAQQIMKGYDADHTFKPEASITRAEAVVTLDRANAINVNASQTVSFNESGSYGPATGIETVNKNVAVNTAGVTLQNMVINGDLLLGEGIGNGDAFINNVKVTGKVTIQGGGENSIHFNNSVLIDIIIDKKSGTGIVRIVSEGSTTVALVIVNSPAIIQETNSTGTGFGDINISSTLPADSKVTLKGSFNTVNVNAQQIQVDVPEGSIQSVNANAASTGMALNLGAEATIHSLVLDAIVKMLGQGTIVAATINTPGTTFEKPAAAIKTPVPTSVPTPIASSPPVATPTAPPVATPTAPPVATPTATSVATPTETPVATPTATPVATPTETPVATPTATPIATPIPVDLQNVIADKSALEIIYRGSDTATNVTQALNELPLVGLKGSTISWSSDLPMVISNDGQSINRPLFGLGNITVHLIATITSKAISDTKEFILIVIEKPQTADEAITAAKAALTANDILGANTSLTEVTKNLILSTSGTNGTTITWSSTNLAVTNSGEVTQPSLTSADATGDLTATITKSGGQAQTKVFAVTVPKLELTADEAITAAIAALIPSTILNGNASLASVKTSLTLSTIGTNGTTIAWSSTNTAINTSTGEITRPENTSVDATGNLTAMITKANGIQQTKVFAITVTKLGAPAVLIGAETYYTHINETGTKIALYISIDGSDASHTYRAYLGDWNADLPEYNGVDALIDILKNAPAEDGSFRTLSTVADVTAESNRLVFRTKSADLTSSIHWVYSVEWFGSTGVYGHTLTGLVDNQNTASPEIVLAKADLIPSTILNENAMLTSVTTDLLLSTTGTYGTSIVWSSDNAAINAKSGAVTRPAFIAGDVIVNVTATITKSGGATQTKVFVINVASQLPTSDEAITIAKAALQASSILNANMTLTDVTTNLTLSTSGEFGTTITWSSNNAAINAITGVVTRPHYTSVDAIVNVTATIAKSGGTSQTKEFVVTVTKAVQTANEAISNALAALVAGTILNANTTLSEVTTDLTLSIIGTDGTTIAWSSANLAITNSGVVTQPTFTVGPISGDLTATISKLGGDTQTKIFTVTVTALPQTANEAISAAIAALVESDLLNGNTTLTAVTTELILPASGADGTTIAWSSTNPAIDASSGLVTQPAYSAGDTTVDLTATITKLDGTPQTKVFTVTVTKLAETTSEAIAAIGGYASADNADTLTMAELTLAGVTGLITENLEAYQAAIAAAKATDLDTLAKIQAFVESVNTRQVAVTLIMGHVTNHTTLDLTIADFTAAGVSGTLIAKLGAYQSAIEVLNATDVNTTAKIQAVIDTFRTRATLTGAETYYTHINESGGTKIALYISIDGSDASHTYRAYLGDWNADLPEYNGVDALINILKNAPAEDGSLRTLSTVADVSAESNRIVFRTKSRGATSTINLLYSVEWFGSTGVYGHTLTGLVDKQSAVGAD